MNGRKVESYKICKIVNYSQQIFSEKNIGSPEERSFPLNTSDKFYFQLSD
jgi:hypothetical protein